MEARKCVVALLFAASVAMLAAGCLSSEQLEQNKRQLEQQQAQLEKLQADLAALQAQQNYAGAATAPGGCDQALMGQATRHGDDEAKAGSPSGALGYYKDAVSACPGNARAEFNLARAYQAIGDRGQAIAHYRKASAGTGDAGASEQARQALERLSSSR